jgi:hypothetical protein
LLFLQKPGTGSFGYAQSRADAQSLGRATPSPRDAGTLGAAAWAFESEETASLLAKLQQGTRRLLDLPAAMGRGSSTGDDHVFVFEAGNLHLEEAVVRRPVFATDFGRYRFASSSKWNVVFPYLREGETYRQYREQEFKAKFPRAFAYLHENQAALKHRKQYREWFSFSAPRNLELQDEAQIAIPLLANRGLCALIPPSQRGRLCPMASGGFTLAISAKCPLQPEYVLGLLNSKLLFWRLGTLSNLFRGGWITCTKQYFGELPIHNIDLANPSDKARHDQVVQWVQRLLGLHQRLEAAKSPPEKTALERQIAAADSQIDRLVYELYGLTEDEIKIVEAAAT